MKIKPRRKTGLSAKYQRKVAKAVKQARIAGLLGFVPK
jgi:small subunit ribosomal protein S18